MSIRISSKRLIPQLPRTLIQRQQLVAKINDNWQKKIIYVQGNPGSGKTTLISSILRQQESLLQTSWLTLFSELNEEELFWSYFFECLLALGHNKSSDFFKEMMELLTKVSPKEGAMILLNQLSETDWYLVIDDFHLIKNQKIISDLAFVLDLLPLNGHLIFISRELPPFSYGKYQIAGELLLIREDELVLSQKEASDFVSTHVKGQFISEAQQLECIALAEGWLAGLGLLLSDYSETTPSKVPMTKIDKRYLYDYLKNEIFKQLAPDLQLFLKVTVQFPYVNQEITEALFPAFIYNELLEQLNQSHVMMQYLDEEERIFCYHPIFSEYFEKLVKEQPSEINDNYLNMGRDYFHRNQNWEEAAQLSIKQKDYERAMTEILKIPSELKRFSYMKSLPINQIWSNLEFVFQRFFYHYSHSQLDICQELYQLAMIEKEKNSKYQLFEGLGRLIGQHQSESQGGLLRSLEIEKLGFSEETKALILIKNVSVLFYQNQYREGLKQVKINQEHSRMLVSDYLNFYNSSIEAQLLEEVGELQQGLLCYQEFHKFIEQSETFKGGGNFFELSYYVSILGIYLKQMDFEACQKCFEKIEQIPGNNLHHEAILYNRIVYRYLKEEPAEGLRLFEQLAQQQDRELLLWADLLAYPLAFQDLSQKVMMTYLVSYEKAESVNLASTLGYLRLLGIVDPEKCLLKIDDFLLQCRKEKVWLKLIEGNLVKLALLVDQPKHYLNCQALYLETLYYSCDEKIKAPFYLERNTLSRFFACNYQSLLSNLKGRELAFHQELCQDWQLLTVNPLTKREMEVLHEMATGKTNKEIAEALFISQGTVKTHIIHIYQKLEVNSRVLAVEKGLLKD